MNGRIRTAKRVETPGSFLRLFGRLATCCVVGRPFVNLILFEPHEPPRPLRRDDPRARHILEVLRRGVGDAFDAGIINGPRGRGSIIAIAAETIELTFSWQPPTPRPAGFRLIVGLPRPQTARDILRDATTLGAAALDFVVTEKSDPSYAQSTLWSSGEWRRRLVAGAEQAFDTWIPDVTHGRTLPEALATLEPGTTRLALDNYEAALPLGTSEVTAENPVVLAIGAERGWSARERSMLREHGFRFVHLGPRVLRTETAVIAALAIIRARQRLI